MESSLQVKVSRDFPYYVSIIMIALGNAMEASSLLGDAYAVIKTPWMLTILLLMVWSAILFSFTMKELLGFLVSISLGFYISHILGRNWFIYFTFALFFVKGKSIDSVVKMIFRCVSAVFLVNILFFFVYLAIDPGVLFVKDGNRYNMFCGTHPNEASRQFLFCCFMYIYLNFEKLNYKRWMGLAAAAAVIYYFTRSDALLLLVLAWMIWLFRKRSLPIRMMRFFAKYGAVTVLLVSLSSILLIRVPALHGIYELVNTLSTDRARLNMEALNLYGITWFGADTKFGIIDYQLVYADNAYIYMLIHQGAFFFFPMALLFGAAARKLDYRGVLFVLLYLLYGIIENGIFDMIAYVPLIISMYAIYPQKKKQEMQIGARKAKTLHWQQYYTG